MIDPREVRAGNWVLTITRTARNTQSFFEYRAIAPDEYYYTFANVCFPITITTSILAKSGFTHEFGDWYINRPAEGIDDGLPFLRYHHADGCWYLEKNKLWSQPLYIHQLQNLFYALCGEELNIQLGHFKNIALVEPIDFFIKAIGKKAVEKKFLIKAPT
jgi:hypothetical protein